MPRTPNLPRSVAPYRPLKHVTTCDAAIANLGSCISCSPVNETAQQPAEDEEEGDAAQTPAQINVLEPVRLSTRHAST